MSIYNKFEIKSIEKATKIEIKKITVFNKINDKTGIYAIFDKNGELNITKTTWVSKCNKTELLIECIKEHLKKGR